MNTPSTNPLTRGRDLWLAYIDDTLSPADAPELNHLLKTYPELRREAALLVVMDVHLHSLVREHPELFDSQPTRNRPAGEQEQERADALNLTLYRTRNLPPRDQEQDQEQAPILYRKLYRKLYRPAVILSAAAGIALTAIITFLILNSASPTTARISRLEGGSATLTRAGRSRPAKPGIRVGSGDRLQLSSNAALTITYPKDGTWVRLSHSALVQVGRVAPSTAASSSPAIANSISQPASTSTSKIKSAPNPLIPHFIAHLISGPESKSKSKSKSIEIQRGSLSARIAPQRSAPMRFITPLADATVLGTELDLTVTPDSTRLDVWQGHVHFTRASDQAALDVGPRQFAIARRGDTSPFATGQIHLGLIREFWLNIEEPTPPILADAPQFQLPPDGADARPNFDGPLQWADTFLARYSALLRVPLTGDYTFWIAGDDRAELWLSPDDSPARKSRIAYATLWTAPEEWDKSPSQQSAPIHLEAGRSYYIEALQQELFGGDCLTAGLRIPNRPDRQIINGEFLSPPASPPEAPPTPP